MEISERMVASLMRGSVLYLTADFSFSMAPVFTELNGHNFCGSCRMCRRAEKLYHPDFEISTDSSVDEARRISSLNDHFPNEVHTRLVAIRGPRNADFQNVMLKVLEEPRPGTRYLWMVADRNSILPTVLSRCSVIQDLKVRRPVLAKALRADVSAATMILETKKFLTLLETMSEWGSPDAQLAAMIQIRIEQGESYADLIPVYEVLRRRRPSANLATHLMDILR